MKPLWRYVLAAFLLTIGVGGFSLFWTHGATTTTADCSSILASAGDISTQITNASATTKPILIRQASHLIVDHASCFDASTVAAAEAAIDQ